MVKSLSILWLMSSGCECSAFDLPTKRISWPRCKIYLLIVPHFFCCAAGQQRPVLWLSAWRVEWRTCGLARRKTDHYLYVKKPSWLACKWSFVCIFYDGDTVKSLACISQILHQIEWKYSNHLKILNKALKTVMTQKYYLQNLY